MQNSNPNNNNSVAPSAGPTPSLPEAPFFEAEYEIVEACKKFLKDCEDSSKTRVLNPWTSKAIKKYGSTYFKIYQDVKKYLNSVDEEEFHSPIRGVELLIQKVAPLEIYPEDYHLCKKESKDIVLNNWHTKVLNNLKDWEKKESNLEVEQSRIRISNWKYDSLLINFDESQMQNKMNRWIENNIQLYSFLDYYKPELFQNKYLSKHLICFNYNFTNFTNYLHYNCDLFLTKRYESSVTVIPTEQRYAPAMIMIWIYHPLIHNGRKFLSKHKKRLETFIKSKPSIKIAKQHISSLLLASFIVNAKVENLEEIKKDYDTYFDKIMTESLRKYEREGILGRIAYRTLLTNFLANRIRPYRYTDFTFSELENFDQIIQGLNEPERTNEDTQPEPRQTNPLENPDSDNEEEISLSSVASVPLAPPRFIRASRL
jgi:hypothetical protein